MQRFYADWAMNTAAALENLEHRAAESSGKEMSDNERSVMGGLVKKIGKDCTTLSLVSAGDYLRIFGEETLSQASYADVRTCARTVRRLLEEDLKRQHFLQLNKGEASVFGKDKPFGDAVHKAFPSANEDLIEACNCWALGRYTASVFHSMQALEPVLRLIADDVGASFDIAVWHNAIDGIEAKIREQANALPKGSPKLARLQFLSEAAKEFRYFKDGWRNYVSHGHAKYDVHTSRSVVNHVGDFMNSLAKQLHE